MAKQPPPKPRKKQHSPSHLYVRTPKDPWAITAPVDPTYGRRRSTRQVPNSYADWAEERTAHNYVPKEEL